MAEPAIWPAGLPQQPERNGYRENLPNNTLRADMEYGPAKTRRRSSAATRKVTLRFLLEEQTVLDGMAENINQKELFEAFYASVDCTQSFWLPNPKNTDVYMLARIIAQGDDEGPAITPAGAFSWFLDLTLEIFPLIPPRARNA